MIRLLPKSLVALALFTSAGVTAQTPPKKDPLADVLGGQIFFIDQAPPSQVGGPGWFNAHKITTKDETADGKWPLHTMVFLRKPLGAPKMDLMIYKIDKKGNVDFVQKVEQYPNAADRSHYFVVTLAKAPPLEPNLTYQIKATVPGGGAVAEGTILLTGREEKIGGVQAQAGAASKLAIEKKDTVAPFDAEAAKQALGAVDYRDCRTAGSKGGEATLLVRLAAKDGAVVRAEFSKETPAPYSDATQTCIVERFGKAKTKPFAGEDKTLTQKVSLEVTPAGDKPLRR